VLTEPLGLTGVALALCVSGAGYLIAVVLTNRQFRSLAS